MNHFRLLFLALLALSLQASAKKPRLVIIAAETEYHTPITIPAICEQNLGEQFDIQVVTASESDRHTLDGFDAASGADVLVLSLWRTALPAAQLTVIRQHIASGKPVVAIRTASHGFALRANMDKPKGHETWDTFDADVLGGTYHGHGPSEKGTTITVAKSAKKHAAIRGVEGTFSVRSWLYYTSPLAKDCTVLLEGTDGKEKHPVSWTRKLKSGSRVFYTSLGHSQDFENRSARNSLINGICWAAGVDIPKSASVYEPYGSFAEKDFPFVTTIVDAGVGKGPFPKSNVTVRGVVLKLSPQISAVFDTDLCRLSAVWTGGLVELKTMAPNSYSMKGAGNKTPGGFGPIGKIIGKPISALGVYPGVGESTADPRSKKPFPRNPARGPISPELARWGGVSLTTAGAVLNYTVGKRVVSELLEATETGTGYIRHIRVGAGDQIVIKLGVAGPHYTPSGISKVSVKNGIALLTIPPLGAQATTAVAVGSKKSTPRSAAPSAFTKPMADIWPEVLHTRSRKSSDVESNYLHRDIPLPSPNPWRRNVRAAGIDFFADGRAAIVTFDGDVWIAGNLDKRLRGVTWKRFASGMYEPLNLSIVNDKIYVFHRNEVTRLHDDNKDGFADRYENFCNLPVQSMESREFALDIVKRPSGGFYVAKGGQQAKERGVHGACILAISADGRTIEVVARDTREAFLGIHPKTGALFGSDQQGHFVPATPVYQIRPGDKYGYAKLPEPKEKPYDPTAPMCWIPHRVLQSGAGLVWPTDKRFGPLTDRLLCLDYFRPGMGVVLCDPDKREFGAASLRVDFPAQCGLLHGAVNPKDGLLYLVGFQIWGSKGTRVSSLSRIEPRKGHDAFPTAVRAYQEGVLISFSSAVDAKSLKPVNFNGERWNYQRTAKYGSPHYTLSGETGQDQLFVQSLTLSTDKKSTFIRFADMRTSMQLQIDYDLKLKNGAEAKRSVWLTPRKLARFRPADHGFPALAPARAFDAASVGKTTVPTIEIGKSVSEKFGCLACHSIDGSVAGRIGPSWKGVVGSKVALASGKTVKADHAFIRESILEPAAKVRKGFDGADAGMPSYAGVLKPFELESVILYIQSLK